MASITVRDLTRDAKAVFDQMERDQAPVLITRNGRPVAALVPVDPDHAEAVTLAASTELIEDRNRAQNAYAEGRTRPLDDLLDNADAAGGTDDEQSWHAALAPTTTFTVVEGDTLFNIAKQYLDEDRLGDLVLAVAASVDHLADARAREIVARELDVAVLQSTDADVADAAVRNAAFRLGQASGPDAVGAP